MPEQLLRVEEARQRLRISRAVLYDLLHRGELRSVLIGRSRRIVESSIDELIAKRAQDGAA